jgi:O-antigen ligase
MLCLAFANLHYGYRSQIAVVLVALVISIPMFGGQTKVSVGMRRVRITALVLLSLGAVWASQQALKEAVARGYFDESLQQKFEAQSAGKLGVILGARPEIPAALQAIADDPVFGHGSYAVDPKYLGILADYQFKYGYSGSDTPEDLEDPGIPTHSHLTAAWVESGVLGSFLWFYLIWLNVRGVIAIADTRPALSPLYAWLFITFIWDILFSPFGYDRRVFEGFFIVLLINLTSHPATVAAIRRVRPYAKTTFRATPGRVVFPRLPRPS